MEKAFTVEYKDNENQEQYIDVELSAYIEYVDDSFSHEFGTEKFEPYPQLGDYPRWDKDEFTFSENWVIAIWLITNLKSIEKSFCDLELSFANDFDNY